MRNYFKELDEYLIKNKPEIWLTKCHCYIPIAFFILIFVLAFQIFLPTCFNIYIILTSTSIIAIILFVLMLRNQFVYFNKNFNENQLLSIYGINFLAILLFSLIAIGPPYLFGKRAFSINENRLFAIDKDNIRIAMIKYYYIKTIKYDN